MTIEDRKRARRMSISNRELLIATAESDLSKINNLLKSGVDVDFKDRDGNAAIHWAVECGNAKAVSLLLSKGASLHEKNNKAETPIDVGKRINDKHIIDILRPPTPPKKEKSVAKSEPNLSSASEVQKCDVVQSVGENTVERRKNPVHGNIYQLKLLMLFLYRGVSHKYSFRLGTEIQEAKKFDDLVFEYDVEGKKMYRLLQAKHRLDERKKINTGSLLAENDGDYNLIKYFFSYLTLKKDKLFSEGFVKDVTICTNIDFDFKNLQSNGITVEKIMEKDEILDVKSEKKESARYKFGENIVQKLKSKLQNCSSSRSRKTDSYTDSDIVEFIKCLVFAVNQPNEDELGNIVKHEISQEFDFVTAENVYNKFFVSMLNWLQGKEKSTFLSFEDGKEFFVEFNKNIQLWFGVRGPVDSFSGRSEILNDVHRMLHGDKAENRKSQFVCVSGLGGVGKSELARKYISTYSQEYDNKIVWINAESYQTLANSFRRLACDKLKISTVNVDNKEKKLNSIVEDVYTFFNDKKCLFVFDNAENYKSKHEFDDGIQPFLPTFPDTSNRIHVLITSRNQKWPKKICVLSLNVFSETEAMEFVQMSLNLKDNEQSDEIKNLVNELQCFPLALQQAVAYIDLHDEKLKNTGSEFKINNYLKKCQQRAKTCFKFTSDNENDYSETTYSTWNITFDAIRQKENGVEACELLEILSYFAPTDISVHTITALIQDKTKLASAFDLLKQYSIINVKNEILSLHRLVIKVITLQLQDQKREKKILNKALNLFSTNTLTPENIEHAISVWNHSNKYSKIINKFSYLPPNIINMLIQNFRLEEAELFGMKALKQLDALTAKCHKTKLDLLVTTEQVVLALRCRGKYELSAKYCESAYEMQKNMFGPQSLEALEGKKNMSECLLCLDKFESALELCEEIIEIESKTLGEINLTTLKTLYRKARILKFQEKFEESLSILNKILNIRKTVLGKNHLETLIVKDEIVSVLLELGKVSEATKLDEESAPVQEIINCADFSAQMKKGKTLLKSGKFKEALLIFQEAYESEKTVLGEDHPDTMMTQCKIGHTLRDIGKLDESLQVLKNVYEKQRKILGPDRLDTIVTIKEIAATLMIQNKSTEALKLLQDSLKKCETVHGLENPLTLKVISMITAILMEQTLNDPSYMSSYNSHLLKYKREILEVSEKKLGNDPINSLPLKHHISLALLASDQFDEAATMLKEVCSKCVNPFDPLTLLAKKDLVQVLLLQKKFDEALKLNREILHFQEITIGKKHIETFVTKIKIVCSLLNTNKNYSAFKMCHEIYNTADREVLKILGVEKIKQFMDQTEAKLGFLFMIIRKNDFETLQKLLDEGHEVNTANRDNITLLHYAAGNDRTKIVEILLKNGADVTLVCKLGNTALHLAAANSSLDVVKLLLKFGSTHDMRNEKGVTPLTLCRKDSVRGFLMYITNIFEDAVKGDTEILKKLARLTSDELEAIQKTRNSQGKTFLQVIIMLKHKELSNKVLEIIHSQK